MKKTKVIKNIPNKLPLTSTVLYTFLLYYFDVNGIVWGIFGTIYAIYWILVIVIIYNQERIDLFNEEETKDVKPTFKERLAEKQGHQPIDKLDTSNPPQSSGTK